MASFQNIMGRLEKILGPQSQELIDLEALWRAVLDARAAETDPSESCHEEPYNQHLDACDSEERDGDGISIEYFKAHTRSVILGIARANHFCPDFVDDLHRHPLIADAVHQPGSRLLVVRVHFWEPRDDQRYLPCWDSTCRFDICDDEKILRSVLSSHGFSLPFVFGCGSGYVTDQCLEVKTLDMDVILPFISVAARYLKGEIRRLVKSKAIRTEENGIRVWCSQD